MSWLYFIFGLGAGAGVGVSVISHFSNHKNHRHPTKEISPYLRAKDRDFQIAKMTYEHCKDQINQGNTIAKQQEDTIAENYNKAKQELIEALKKEIDE